MAQWPALCMQTERNQTERNQAERTERNPQAEQMAHESMVRNLAAQAEAIWPQERPLFARYGLARGARVLDVGCGTGEIALRLAREFPGVHVLGIDVHDPHLELARERARRAGADAEFRTGDAYALALEGRSVDVALCRHMLQAVPEPRRILAEMARVTRPGGHLHLVVEDYGMIHCHPCAVDADRFWREGPVALGERTGTDLHGGRKAYHWLSELGLVDVRVDYAILDPTRVERRVLVDIFAAWRDGYTEVVARHGRLSPAETRRGFQAIVDSFADPAAYGVWLLPIVSGRVP
jgi:ubiquinone/menaquinone biosynthesis C-methylase UbiE